MKRSTKKIVFLTTMTITLCTLFATVGRHHCFMQKANCYYGSHHQCESNRSNHHNANSMFDWHTANDDSTTKE